MVGVDKDLVALKKDSRLEFDREMGYLRPTMLPQD